MDFTYFELKPRGYGKCYKEYKEVVESFEKEIHFLKIQLVYSFREITGVGKRDAEKALQENNYNIPKAIEWIKKKGLC